MERELLQLPGRYDGLATIISSKISNREYENSKKLTEFIKKKTAANLRH